MAAPPRRKPATRQNQAPRGKNTGSITFLLVLLFILAITVFILSFKDPIARFVTGGSVVAKSTTTTLQDAGTVKTPDNKTIVVDGGAVPSTTIPAARTTTTIKNNNPDSNGTTLTTSGPSKEDLKNVTLYFSKVDDSGQITTEKTERSIRFSESPLSSSIKALLKGPSGPELSEGMVTMIPAGTSLLSAWVRDSIAYLNFSESFQFNPLGADGLRAQVRQVVWVATEFPTVKSVQILIEGKNVEYLGGDNVAVGKPLKRSDLP